MRRQTNLRFIVMFITSFIFLNSTPAQSIETKIDEGTEVTVTGLPYTEYFYEEINYGDSPETDTIAGACLLKLDSPLPFKEKKLDKVHLVFSNPTKLNCSQLVGHRVQVTGTLDEPTTGHHHADGMLSVKEEKILR